VYFTEPFEYSQFSELPQLPQLTAWKLAGAFAEHARQMRPDINEAEPTAPIDYPLKAGISTIAQHE
jgi:hypothetical protein